MIVAIVLAAGLSRRFPGNKLLYMIRGKPVIRWTVEHILSSRVDDVVVVLGHMADDIRRALGGLDVHYVYNPEYRAGMSSSVKKGLEEAMRYEPDAVMVNPGDVFLVPPEAYTRLYYAYYVYRPRILVACYGRRHGHPILFDKTLFPEIMNISEEKRGLKEIIWRHRSEVEELPLPYPGIVTDLDRPEDLERLKRIIEEYLY